MKGSMLGKAPGDDPAKFATIRAFYVYMMTMPGKKLNMMGTEIGQFNEWHYEYSWTGTCCSIPSFRSTTPSSRR